MPKKRKSSSGTSSLRSSLAPWLLELPKRSTGMFIIVLHAIYLGYSPFLGHIVNVHSTRNSQRRFGSNAEAATQEERERDRFLVDLNMDTAQNDAAQQWTCGRRNLAGEHRLPLPPEMRPFFNFTTSIRTNLKILVMGDSVGMQLSQYLQKSVLEGSSNNGSNNNHSMCCIFLFL